MCYIIGIGDKKERVRMKYLVAVKFIDHRVEIFEFPTKKDRELFIKDIIGLDYIHSFAKSQIK